MPKLIDDLRNTILQAARRQLLEIGYDKLTMRSVAAECGVAVGTLYNYFSAKDVLIASTMLDDWLRSLQKMQNCMANADDPLDGLRSVYSAISEFTAVYSPSWSHAKAQAAAQPFLHNGHRQLLDQLAGAMRPMLARLAPDTPDSFLPYLAELILQQAVNGEGGFEALAPVLAKLLS